MKKFLSKIPKDKVEEVCMDMKEGLRTAAEAVFPSARVVVDPFHVIADSNKRMDEARRIEQDVYRKRKVQIPKKLFLVGREKLTDEKKQKWMHFWRDTLTLRNSIGPRRGRESSSESKVGRRWPMP